MGESDRELLELAAKAAGFQRVEWVPDHQNNLRPCPACRGYELERRWCRVCDGRGVVDVEAQQKERAERVRLLREFGIEVRD